MELLKLYEKQVDITDFDNKHYIGFVSEYIYPEDNENGEESIIVETKKYPIEFTQKEIKSIQILD